MDRWTAQDWAILLAALASAIGTVVNAFQNKGLKKQVDDNHAETLAAVQGQPAPPA